MTSNRKKRVLFDLNHPADFHFFKHLMHRLTSQGYTIKIVARDKECLHMLLDHAQMPYTSRGKGKHSLVGKYLYAIWIMVLLTVILIRFRPGITMSLSSPYLAMLSRLMNITCITYDDTDDNPRLLPLIKKSTYLFSPASYPHSFHKDHFHLPALKELAYLHPALFKSDLKRSGIFFRLTRTDSVHHSMASKLDLAAVQEEMDKLSREHPVTFSAESDIGKFKNEKFHRADPIDIHHNLSSCTVFWGNSATMAAEAAVLGIPAIFISAEKFAYISELESYGLLYYYHPKNLEASFIQLEAILKGDPPVQQFRQARDVLLREKIDMTAFMSWFTENLPGSGQIMETEPEFALRFISR